MSLCDTCKAPGACCRSLTLQGGIGQDHERFHLGMTEEESVALLDHYDLPFVPYGMSDDGQVLFTCPELDNDGRCKIYDRRPQVCRDFEPSSSPLCVHYSPKET